MPETVTHLLSSESPPAGGAALGEVFLATAMAAVLTAVLLGSLWAHRTGRTERLATVASAMGRGMHVPGWVALPTALATTSLLVALLGMYWDIALHIGEGRDEGPLANPAHFLILFGLFGLFAAGVTAMALPRGVRPGPAALRLTRGWYVPVGGLLVAGAGLYALLGFPLDDVWHRLFGQDVTLWGPTHLMLIGGAGLSLVGVVALQTEGLSPRSGGARAPSTRGVWLRRVSAMGGLLIGLSVFQGEWDFGVPQFRMVFQPFLLAVAAGMALVAARLWIGRGAALAVVGFFLLVRGTVTLLVGPVFGEITPSLPLYLGSALVVEAVALVLVRRPLLFGVIAGAGVGTLGFASEWAWTQVAFRLPWTADLLPEGLGMSLIGGVAGGLVGALLTLGLEGRLPRPAVSRGIFVGAVLTISACVANGLVITVPEDVSATIELDITEGADGRTGTALVTLDPSDAADDPSWVNLTAWQGGGLVVDQLEEVGEGAWRSTRPIPLDGSWKTVLRIQDGRDLAAVPVFLAADPAIDAPETPALASTTRPVVPEIEVLQRERDLDAPAWLWTVACLVVLACSLVLVAALAWGVARVSRARRDADAAAPRDSGAADDVVPTVESRDEAPQLRPRVPADSDA
jgi:hypothetical protein